MSDAITREKGKIQALLLVFVFFFTSLVCAAMAPGPLPAAHPCCPPTGHQSQDNCLRMRCISTAPVLLPASVDNRTELVTFVSAEPALAATDLLRQRVPDASPGPLPHELFLSQHQFRV
jgi:hypothetical protein